MGGCMSANGIAPGGERMHSIHPAATSTTQTAVAPGVARAATDPLKIILPGCGESGKSTVFKQVVRLFGAPNSFGEYERSNYSPILMNNIITSAKTLLRQCQTRGVGTWGSINDAQDFDLSRKSLGRYCGDIIDDLKGDETLEGNIRDVLPILQTTLQPILLKDLITIVGLYATESLAHIIHNFWQLPEVQHVYKLRSEFQLTHMAKYILDGCVRFADPQFVPTFEDVLVSRVRTTGIVENEFVVDDPYLKRPRHFRMFDLGGNRNERKKWLHCFEGVDFVWFMCAISEFDQVLYEDENTNRLVDSLQLFEEIVNSRWFHGTRCFLIFNKFDTFRDKILIDKTPITVCFPDYDGDLSSPEQSLEHIRRVFMGRVHNSTVHAFPPVVHVMNALDSSDVQKLMALTCEFAPRD